ncbi:MAG: methionine adenosyltransferase [Elusimicrobia bacterium RIFOXYD2_FULL_34_15]|nr:MAG: methionine adenosyltransferase [Elusimicrobia bacterium RIFOXYD2_FULL_34_15]
MFCGDYVFTSESVTEGHPDKVCDQISDAVLDEVYRQDSPLKNNFTCRVACETYVTAGLLIVGGEITTKAYIDVPVIARRVIKDIGYTDVKYGFNYQTCGILNAIGRQSPDISQGVSRGKEIGAGDQGLMIGYACTETKELMPLPITLAQELTMRLAEVRKKNILKYVGPDGKSQVTVKYVDGRPVEVDKIVISTQHTEDSVDKKTGNLAKWAKDELIETVIMPTIPKNLLKNFSFKNDCFVNPTGRFVVGGPQSDTGMTGRKIIVDTYGGMAPHGGGAFSGKDPTKVDRSACYMARYIAKNIVAAGLAEKCMVQLAYAIGVAEPVSIMVDTLGTGRTDGRLEKVVRKVFSLTPKGIIDSLELHRPIYQKTAAYGHFGRKEFTWERTDKAAQLKSELR